MVTVITAATVQAKQVGDQTVVRGAFSCAMKADLFLLLAWHHWPLSQCMYVFVCCVFVCVCARVCVCACTCTPPVWKQVWLKVAGQWFPPASCSPWEAHRHRRPPPPAVSQAKKKCEEWGGILVKKKSKNQKHSRALTTWLIINQSKHFLFYSRQGRRTGWGPLPAVCLQCPVQTPLLA